MDETTKEILRTAPTDIKREALAAIVTGLDPSIIAEVLDQELITPDRIVLVTHLSHG